jgi:predicted RNA methylase
VHQIDQTVLEILSRATIEGATPRLPAEQLDRKTYQAVNTVIEVAGGKWNKKAKAHLFEGDAIDTIEPMLITGIYTKSPTIKQELGQFDSPPDVVARVIELAQIAPGMMVLEPSAGIGNLVLGAEAAGGKVAAYEVDADRLHRCKDRCLLVGGIHLTDFLLAKPAPVFDRVVMNPPFAKQLDVAHVMRAFDFLRMGGRLVSVMSTSFQFRPTKSAEQFRDFLASVNAEVEPLPNGAFKDSGTMVNSVIVSFDDPR